MKNKKLLYAIIFSFSICGCTTTIPLDFTLSDVPTLGRKNVEMISLTIGYSNKGNPYYKKLNTNHLVPPIWKASLEDAIHRSLVFSDGVKTKIHISVRIYEFDTASPGASMTSTSGAVYEIVDRESGKVLFKENIRASGTVPFNYAFSGLIRIQESINRTVKNNILNFLYKLEKSNF